MRELEQRERRIKEIQNTGDRLLREDHPGRPTVEVGGGQGSLWSHGHQLKRMTLVVHISQVFIRRHILALSL